MLSFLERQNTSHVLCCPTLMYVSRTPKVMMIQNIAVDQRFANGTQGRLLHWHPTATQSIRKALPAYSQDLLGRFCKESSLSKTELMPGACFCCTVQTKLSLNVFPSLWMMCIPKHTTRYRFHGSWGKARELACQRRADHVTAVRCPSVFSHGTIPHC